MEFKRSLQWQLRLHSLDCKWIILNQFYPMKSLFVRKRFVRLHKLMLQYMELEQKEREKEFIEIPMKHFKVSKKQQEIIDAFDQLHKDEIGKKYRYN